MKEHAKNIEETVAENKLVQTGFVSLQDRGCGPCVGSYGEEGDRDIDPEEEEGSGLVDRALAGSSYKGATFWKTNFFQINHFW